MIPDGISFIRKMKNLKFFSFVKTNIKDGDITPCLGLEYAGFDDKRHYSHRMKQVNRIISERNGQEPKIEG